MELQILDSVAHGLPEASFKLDVGETEYIALVFCGSGF